MAINCILSCNNANTSAYSSVRIRKSWLGACFHSVLIIYLAFKLDLEFLKECMG